MGERFAPELRRQWESAYIDYYGYYDEGLREECMELVAVWRALWAIASAGKKRHAFLASSISLTYQHFSLRGYDTWQMKLASLGACSPCRGGGQARNLHAVIFSWRERDHFTP